MKNIKILKIIVGMIFIAGSWSCDPDNDGYGKWSVIWIQNNSSMIICPYIQMNYPDTALLPLSKSAGFAPDEVGIDVKEKYLQNYSWKKYIKDNNLFETIELVIYSKDTLVKYKNYKEIVYSSYNILKRYDLSIADLERMNWTIVYDGQ